jgi:hypothetical protein
MRLKWRRIFGRAVVHVHEFCCLQKALHVITARAVCRSTDDHVIIDIVVGSKTAPFATTSLMVETLLMTLSTCSTVELSRDKMDCTLRGRRLVHRLLRVVNS